MILAKVIIFRTMCIFKMILVLYYLFSTNVRKENTKKNTKSVKVRIFLENYAVIFLFILDYYLKLNTI